MDNRDFSGFFDMDPMIDNVESTFDDMDAAFEKFSKNMSKRERQRMENYYEDQMEFLKEQLKALQEIREVSEDTLGDIEKEMVDTFLNNRRRDLRKYEVAYNRSYKSMNRTQSSFFKNIDSGFDRVIDKVSNFANIATALNINNIGDSFKDTVASATESLYNIRSTLNLTETDMEGLKSELSAANERARAYGGTISRQDLYNAVDTAVSEFGVRDKALAVEIGEELAKWQSSLGVEDSLFEPIQQFVRQNELSTGYIRTMGDYIKSLESTYSVTSNELISSYSNVQEHIGRIANGSEDVANELTSRYLSATAMAESSYFSSDRLTDIFKEVMGGDLRSLIGVSDAAGVQSKIQQGLYDEATAEILTGIGNTIASSNGNTLLDKQLQELWDLDSSDYEALRTEMRKNSDTFYDLQSSITSTLSQANGEMERNLTQTKHTGWWDKTMNNLGLSDIGSSLTELQESLDLDANDIMMMYGLFQGGKELFSGGKSLLQGLGGKLGIGKAASGVASASGTGIGGASAGVGGIGLGTIAGGAGAIAAGGTIISAIGDFMSAEAETTWQNAEDKIAQGGIKLAGVASGGAIGAAVGSIVPGLGTVVGGLVGAGLGGVASLIWGEDWADQLTDWIDGTAKIQETQDKLAGATDALNKSLDRSRSVDNLTKEYDSLMKEMNSAAKGTEDYEVIQGRLNQVISELNEVYPGVIDMTSDDLTSKNESVETIKRLTEQEQELARVRSLAASQALRENLDVYYEQLDKSQEEMDKYNNQIDGYMSLTDDLIKMNQMVQEGKLYESEAGNFYTTDAASKEERDWYYDFIKGAKDRYNAAGLHQDWDGTSIWNDDWEDTSAIYKNVMEKGFSPVGAEEQAALLEDLNTKKATIDNDISTSLNNYDLMRKADSWEDVAKNWKDADNSDKTALRSMINDYNAVRDEQRTLFPADIESWADKVGIPITRHATGIGYVPDDNHLALLHKGESVLDRAEADRYRTGGVGSEESLTNAWELAYENSEDSMINVNKDMIKFNVKEYEKQLRRSNGITNWFRDLLKKVTAEATGVGTGQNGLNTVATDGSSSGGNSTLAEWVSSIIKEQEGDYGTVNHNDNGAVSLGKIQWHGNNARDLLKEIREADTASFDSIVAKHGATMDLNADWTNKIYSKGSSLDNATKEILESVAGKQVQDKKGLEYIDKYIEKGKSLGLTDPKALAYYADLVNQYGMYHDGINKGIVPTAIKNGGTLDAIYNATINTFSQYRNRRDSVYNKIKEGSVPAFADGNDRVSSDMIAAIHEDELIVPGKKNPYASGTSIKIGGDNEELVRVVKHGFEAIIRKMEELYGSDNARESRAADSTAIEMFQLGGTR